jgi:hypothetical protein
MTETEPIFGARVTRVPPPASESKKLCPIPQSPLMPSPAVTIQSLGEETHPEFDPTLGAKPCSPFYPHEVTASLEQLKNGTQISGRGYASQDLESGDRALANYITRESKLWEQKRRRCDCLSTLTPRQRLAVKLLMALVIVGTMVGIALGITVSVGGGVWRSNNQQSPIGH